LLGLYLYPPAVVGDELPVVVYFHEEDPTFTWLADGVDAFADMLDGAERPQRRASDASQLDR
jgi:hypothetical protein